MALSPNYGWAEPDNSSLVKNGAADIRTLGDSIDTSVWNIGFGQAGKNKIINGDFGIWQRGTSFVANGYGADRFAGQVAGTASTYTYSRQTFTPGAAPVAGYAGTYFARLAATGTDATTRLEIYQGIEDVRTFAGQTVTVSFWVKGDSARTGTITPYQIFGSGGSASVQWAVSTFAVTTGWTRVSSTFSVPSVSGKTIGTSSQLLWYIGYAGTNATSSPVFDIWGVQIEYGSKATPFQTASGGSPQAELAMCQRYYYRQTAGGAYSNFGLGVAYNTTQAYIYIIPPVTMRVLPTNIEYSSLAGMASPGAAISAITALTIANQGTSVTQTTLVATVTAATFVNASPAQLVAANAPAGYIGLTAELQEMTMNKVTFIEQINPLTNEVTEHAIIDHGNGEFTSMLKSTYDELKANEDKAI